MAAIVERVRALTFDRPSETIHTTTFFQPSFPQVLDRSRVHKCAIFFMTPYIVRANSSSFSCAWVKFNDKAQEIMTNADGRYTWSLRWKVPSYEVGHIAPAEEHSPPPLARRASTLHWNHVQSIRIGMTYSEVIWIARSSCISHMGHLSFGPLGAEV
jgi:hypothetical protein